MIYRLHLCSQADHPLFCLSQVCPIISSPYMLISNLSYKHFLAEKARRQRERSLCKAQDLTCRKDMEAACTGLGWGPQNIFHCGLKRRASPWDPFLSALVWSLRREWQSKEVKVNRAKRALSPEQHANGAVTALCTCTAKICFPAHFLFHMARKWVNLHSVPMQ